MYVRASGIVSPSPCPGPEEVPSCRRINTCGCINEEVVQSIPLDRSRGIYRYARITNLVINCSLNWNITNSCHVL